MLYIFDIGLTLAIKKIEKFKENPIDSVTGRNTKYVDVSFQ